MFRESDAQRKRLGFRTFEELLELTSNNHILDLFSVLISTGVTVGSGNTFYPNVVLECHDEAHVRIGDANIFTPGCLVVAEAGSVTVGSHNLFGDGGFTARLDQPKAQLVIGDNGRYINGVALSGNNSLGSGSQIIGPIRVQNCTLGEGGSFESENPDERGGVLKGYGLARGLMVGQGRVIAGNGTFRAEDIKLQSFYHPKV